MTNLEKQIAEYAGDNKVKLKKITDLIAAVREAGFIVSPASRSYTKYSKKDRDKWAAARAKGMSGLQIAEKFGAKKQAVYDELNRRGI